jgi:uncharacterized membrane protein YidH (DUF202 family)
VTDSVEEKLSRQEQILLVEYQEAQSSAEHHDRLLWTALGLLVTGMAALVAFAISRTGLSRNTQVGIPVLGMIVSFLILFVVYSFGKIRRQKYARCKAIEIKLGMEQHSKLDHPKPGQRLVAYSLGVASCIAWLLWLCRLVRP